MSPTQQTRLALEMAFNKSASMDKEAVNPLALLKPVGQAIGGGLRKAMPTFAAGFDKLLGRGGQTAAKTVAKSAPAAKALGGVTASNVYDPVKVTAENLYNHASLPVPAGVKTPPAGGLFARMIGKAKANPKTTAGIAAAGTGIAGLGYGELRNGQGQEEGAAKAIDGFQGGNLLQRLGAAFAPGQLSNAAGPGVANRVAKLQSGRPPSTFSDYFMGR